MTGMAKGTKPNGKPFKAHLDGYNFLPFFKDDTKECPREEYFYSGMGGELNAIRWNDGKISFASGDGDIGSGTRRSPTFRDSPTSRPTRSGRPTTIRRWPCAGVAIKCGCSKKFMATIAQLPFQEGVSLIRPTSATKAWRRSKR
jgi:hypothetical protein